MKRSILVLILLMISKSSFAIMIGGSGGVRPQAVFSIERSNEISTFSLGTFENSRWSLKTVRAPLQSLPDNVVEALEKSQVSKAWIQLEGGGGGGVRPFEQ